LMDLAAPDWISFDAERPAGLDLLGLRAPVQGISNQLFNGVTTITPKLRYISVITWIIWRYAQALAMEFEKAVRGTAYGVRLAKKPRIESVSRAELQDLATKVSLGKLPPGERELLLGTILPDEPIDAAERRRLANYTLLLWLTREKQAFVEEVDVFTAAQAPPPTLPASLHEITDGWLGKCHPPAITSRRIARV
jgi:hypothetical protein